jgi:predicted flavoprotein YhiN
MLVSNNSEAQMKKYKHIKKTIQQDMRKAYWEFIEQMIFNILDQEPDECRKKQPKNLYSYIKSMKNDNTGIAPLRKEGMLTDNTKDKADILNEQFKNIFV